MNIIQFLLAGGGMLFGVYAIMPNLGFPERLVLITLAIGLVFAAAKYKPKGQA